MLIIYKTNHFTKILFTLKVNALKNIRVNYYELKVFVTYYMCNI